MDRRNFLKGTFGGVTAGGIILAAGIPDTEAFVEQVKIGDPIAASPAITNAPWPNIGEYVFNHQGLIIGVVTGVKANTEIIDVTGRDSWRSYTPGRRRVTFEVDAIFIDTLSGGRGGGKSLTFAKEKW